MSRSPAQLQLLQPTRGLAPAHTKVRDVLRSVAAALVIVLLSPLWALAATDEYRYPASETPLWGFIDGAGRNVIPARFFKASNFSEGLAAVRLEKGCGYVDAAGAITLRLPLLDCEPFHSGRARFKSEATGRWGFYATDGSVAIPAEFQSAEAFSEGFAAVQEGDRWTYIDTKGRRISGHTYSRARRFSEGFAAVAPDDAFGFIDRLGRMVIEPRHKDAQDFHEGLAAVKTPEGWAYIDKRGEFVSPRRWASFVDSYSEGLAAAWLGSKQGFIRKDGSVAIAPRFVDSTRFSGGLAAVKMSDRTDRPTWMYIDRQGNPAFDRAFWHAEPFAGPLALVQLEPFRDGLQRMGYIDRLGNVVSTFTEYDGRSMIRALRVTPTPTEVRLLSRPAGAAVYMVPLFDWEQAGSALLQSPSLAIYRVGNGVTDLTERVYERVYVTVFERAGQHTCRRIDVKKGQLNEVIGDFTEPCR